MNTPAGTDLASSNAWDPRFRIPACPKHLNPHIYSAYAVRVLRGVDGASADVDEILSSYALFLSQCELVPGAISTYPGSGLSSHDDAFGASYLWPLFAGRCVKLLAGNDGVYGGEGASDETKNFYRFLWVAPVMRALAGERVGAWSQAQYLIALLFHLFTTKEGDTSGMLLFWLGFPAMRKFPVCSAAIALWAWRWSARGYTPRIVFTAYYLTDHPWFAKYAREDWV